MLRYVLIWAEQMGFITGIPGKHQIEDSMLLFYNSYAI